MQAEKDRQKRSGGKRTGTKTGRKKNRNKNRMQKDVKRETAAKTVSRISGKTGSLFFDLFPLFFNGAENVFKIAEILFHCFHESCVVVAENGALL